MFTAHVFGFKQTIYY